MGNNLPKEFNLAQNKIIDGKKHSNEQEKNESIKVSEKSDSMKSSDKSDSIKEKSDKFILEKNELIKPPMPHKRTIKTLNP